MEGKEEKDIKISQGDVKYMWGEKHEIENGKRALFFSMERNVNGVELMSQDCCSRLKLLQVTEL